MGSELGSGTLPGLELGAHPPALLFVCPGERLVAWQDFGPSPTLTALSMLLAVSPNSSDLGSAISGV